MKTSNKSYVILSIAHLCNVAALCWEINTLKLTKQLGVFLSHSVCKVIGLYYKQHKYLQSIQVHNFTENLEISPSVLHAAPLQLSELEHY